MSIAKQHYYEQRVHRISTQEARLLFDLLDVKGAVLDVGCGRGDLGLHCPKGIALYGFDHDARVLKANGYKEVKVADVQEKFPYKANMFHGAILKDVVEHVDDPLGVLQKTAVVVRKKGKLLITVPNATPKNVWNDYTHRRGFTKGAISMLCQDAGLSIVTIRSSGGIPGFGMLKLNKLAHIIVNIPLLGIPFRTGWVVVCQK